PFPFRQPVYGLPAATAIQAPSRRAATGREQPSSWTALARLCLFQMRNEIAWPMASIQLLGKNAVPRGTAGIRRTRQATHQGSIRQTGQRPRLDRGAAYIAHGYLAEQLTETINVLVQQASNRFWRAVAAGEPRSASDQYNLYVVIGNPARDLRTDT